MSAFGAKMGELSINLRPITESIPRAVVERRDVKRPEHRLAQFGGSSSHYVRSLSGVIIRRFNLRLPSPNPTPTITNTAIPTPLAHSPITNSSGR
jgi:hypothetical protein